MTDPSVLPATIMQTTSALISIYLVVFILAFPIFLKLRKHFPNMRKERVFRDSIIKSQNIRKEFQNIRKENPDIKAWKLLIIFMFYQDIISGIITLFVLSFISGCFTLYSSMLWLKCLTTNTTYISAISCEFLQSEPLHVETLAEFVERSFILTLIFVCIYTFYIVGLLIFLNSEEIKLPSHKVEIE
jgi:hypothetical protein